MTNSDFLVEIQTEELPPKALLGLAQAFEEQVNDRVKKAGLNFSEIIRYATPRRLALLIKQLPPAQPTQTQERRGPAVAAAFKPDGTPTPACLGFARSCGVEVSALGRIQTPEGEWVGMTQHIEGKSVDVLMPTIIAEALAALPIPKRMRWGSGSVEFSRPVHSVIMLYGDRVVEGTILGCAAGRKTVGHRFHAPQSIVIKNASDYAAVLETEGRVIADPILRAKRIAAEVQALLASNETICALNETDLEALKNEVTGLVEWPVALRGGFDAAFLALPKEVLISSMIDHQRYFPVSDRATGKLQPAFITVSNIESRDPARVVHGNERVLRARLSDAAFFFEADKKERLESRLPRLSGMVYQAKLGSLGDKAERISRLAASIAKTFGADEKAAAQAGLLAKTDLTTNMVGEFPELQGVMGGYYALNDGESAAVALAIEEHYLPRFSGDRLPTAPVSLAVALADRLDLLTGYFGIRQLPTGDKDPYGLRRAALGVVRCLIETNQSLDLTTVLAEAVAGYQGKLENPETAAQVLQFIQERLRPYYQERGIAQDVVAAVTALGVADLSDLDHRVSAVQAFKALEAASALSAANKRVSNILLKYESSLDGQVINASLFESAEESRLASLVEAKTTDLAASFKTKQYQAALMGLAELREPIDAFFDKVMVMTDDEPRRNNRIALLARLRHLFLQVADIALLQ